MNKGCIYSGKFQENLEIKERLKVYMELSQEKHFSVEKILRGKMSIVCWGTQRNHIEYTKRRLIMKSLKNKSWEFGLKAESEKKETIMEIYGVT